MDGRGEETDWHGKRNAMMVGAALVKSGNDQNGPLFVIGDGIRLKNRYSHVDHEWETRNR